MGKKTERVEIYLERTEGVMKTLLRKHECTISDIYRELGIPYEVTRKIVNRYERVGLLEIRDHPNKGSRKLVKHKYEEEVKSGTRLCTQ